MKTAIELIAEERKRQIEKEGYDADHDDTHENEGQLACAAACYALESTGRNFTEQITVAWPWQGSDLKSKTPVADLVRAGALIAAEIDRLQRNPTPASNAEGDTEVKQ